MRVQYNAQMKAHPENRKRERYACLRVAKTSWKNAKKRIDNSRNYALQNNRWKNSKLREDDPRIYEWSREN